MWIVKVRKKDESIREAILRFSNTVEALQMTIAQLKDRSNESVILIDSEYNEIEFFC